jgi:PAS domain S-box-containing protein
MVVKKEIMITWNDFILSGFNSRERPALLRKVKFTNALSLFGIVTLLCFGFTRLIVGYTMVGVVDLLTGAFLASNLVLLRIKKNVVLSSSIGIVGLLGLILFLFVSGGVHGTGIYWFYFFPVTVFFLQGKRGGVIWMIVIYSATFFLHVFDYFHLIKLAYAFTVTVQMLASLLLESVMIYYYAWVMEKSEDDVEQHNAKLEETNQILQNEIGQRQKAENELLKISQAVRSAGDAIAIEDVEGKHIYHNKSFFNLFNYSISGLNIVGGALELFVDRELGKRIFKIVSDGNGWSGEVEVKTKDNRKVPVYLRGNAVTDHYGKKIGSVFIYTDISERKKWENALVSSEERFRKVIASISDHIYMTNFTPEGIPINAYISPNVEKLTGYPYEKFLNDWSFWAKELIHPDDRAAASVQVENFKRGKDSQVEYRIAKKDGKTVWVRDSGRVTKDTQTGQITVYGVVSDIDINKYQEEVKESLLQELQKANRELAEFAYIVSHDLKAPLRAISSLAQWLSEDYKDALDREGREKIDLLLGRTKRMHNLIEGVLAYSRLGRMKPTMSRINSQEETNQIIDLLAPPMNIVVEIKGILPHIVYDRIHFNQVMQNLISNAIKYNDKNQGEIKISCIENRGFWEYTVADNGVGIEDQHFERIFKIFQSLKARDEFESTGIGLTIVKKIVEYYGGVINLTSMPGKGSTFSFTIPKNLKVEDENP